MPKTPDLEFKNHFAKLVSERGMSYHDFIGNHVPADLRISRSTFFRTQAGYIPQKQDTIRRFAELLKCTLEEFLCAPKKRDWERPDVQQFLGEFQLLCIDGAIAIYEGPEHEHGKHFWHVSDIEFQIKDKPFELTELKPFEKIVKIWDEKNKDKKRGMKYCVTEVIRPPIESSRKLTLKVRPIEYHLIKPINDYLTESCKSGENAFAGETKHSQFRRRNFARLQKRDKPPIPNFLTSQLTVISSDNKILLFRRNETGLDSFRGCWSASLEEGFNADWKKYLKPTEVYPPSSNIDPDVNSGLHRALKEELRISDEVNSGTEIQVLAFLLEMVNLNTAIVAIARIPLSAENILSNSRLRSSEEFDCFGYCPFDIPSLMPALLDKNTPPHHLITPGRNSKDISKNWKWHPTSRMRIFCSLTNKFGADAIEENLNLGLKANNH